MMDRFFYAANPMVQFGFGASAGGSETVATSHAGGDRGEAAGGPEADAGGAMRIPTNANSIFGTYGEDSFLNLQQARALAEMDVKGVTASVFHPYHPAAVVDFDTSMGGILHASVDTSSAARSNCNNFQAEMAASLQQQMMQQMASIGMHQHAMHHYSVGHPAGAPSVTSTLYPSAMSSQGMALMGTVGLTNEIGNQSVGGTSFLSPFSHQQQHGGAGAVTSAAHQQQQQQQHRLQQHNTAPLRAQTAQGGAALSMPSVLPSSSTFPPSMVPGLSVLGGVVKPSSQHNPPQQQRYPVLHGAHLADLDTDPRELERFAEHFKQRRIKLGVTQADVGKALAYLKMPGVGSLSQSTICRFESLTLSHNNMVALKPILHSWLERAEEATKNAMAKDGNEEVGGMIHCAGGILPCVEKKRKRTSIAAPEKRMLEEFFRQQSRPTGDRISAIADKLDLKKNVVRVWFCNQRQKQKRNQFRHCRTGVGGGSSASIVASGSANGGGIGGCADANQQQQTSICGNPGTNSQQFMVSPLSNSTAAATLAAAAMQAMQQQQNNNNNNRAQMNGVAGGGAGSNTTAQFRLMKQSQQSDIYGEALIKGTMAQLQTTISSAEEMSEQKVSTENGRIVENGDNGCGVIRHGFNTKANKIAPTDRANDRTTDNRMMETTEMFGATPSAATIFYLNSSRERMAEN